MKKILFLFIVCICFSSCFTTKKYHVAENNAKQTLEQNGITVICEYLDEGKLMKRHGRGDDNPYIAREFALTPVYSLVFEVEIKNKIKEFELELKAEKEQLTNMVPYRALAGFFNKFDD